MPEKKPRTAYYTNDAFMEDTKNGQIWRIAIVTENEAGYIPGGAFSSLQSAQDWCGTRNSLSNLSEQDVSDIVASSFRAGPVNS